jgi:hypothetical protein
VCTFIVILFNYDEMWFYFINCSFADVFYFKNMLVEIGMLMLAYPLLQLHCSDGAVVCQSLRGHCSDEIGPLFIATVTLCTLV